MSTLKTQFKTVLVLLLIQSSVLAGTIKQIKNGKVLIILDGETLKAGDQIYGLNEAGKKTSILQISVVKGDQAIAKILKGTAKANDLTAAKGSNPSAASGKSKTSFLRKDMIKTALNFKILMDTIASEQEDSSGIPQREMVIMKGTNFGVNGSLDFPVYPWLSLRGYLGYEILKVVGQARFLSCDGKTSTNCNVNVNYVSVGGIVRFNYALTNLELWAGMGAGAKQPISKNSTALKVDNIALANTAIIALGADYQLSNSYFIPATFEYHYSFNTSETVPTISTMAVVLGFGLLF